MNGDEFYLTQALKLAAKARGKTFPNPLVGALVVKNGKIIARGYHKQAGQDHAEIAAFRKVSANRLSGSALYVNLEPCCHLGKTPPCVEAIIKARIAKVVCSTLDPNPKVLGKGIDRLRRAGIAVSVGVKAAEAKRLNEAFFTFHETGRPFIALKFAASLDGKIATQNFDSKWVTNQEARKFARRLRGHYQAVLVGINTVLRDNPHLGLRRKGQPDPVRIILDAHLRIPLNSQVLRDNRVLLVTTRQANLNKRQSLVSRGIPVVTFRSKKIVLPSLMKELVRRKIISLLVEGGGQVLGSFADCRLADKVYAFHAPIIIGGEKAISAVGGKGIKTLNQALKLKNVKFKKFGDNILTVGDLSH